MNYISEYTVEVEYGTRKPCSFVLFEKRNTGEQVQIKKCTFDPQKSGFLKTDEEHYKSLCDFLGDIIPKCIQISPAAASFIACINRHGKYKVATQKQIKVCANNKERGINMDIKIINNIQDAKVTINKSEAGIYTISIDKEDKEKKVTLSSIAVGETFKIGKYEFVVLEHTKGTTAVILKDVLFKSQKFGTTNDYRGSYVDSICNDFANEISDIIGKENLIKHAVDLTSDDGLIDYGTISRYMSLLTANLYRRYVTILDRHKIDYWWWLATAYSTPTHGNSAWIKCVSPSGHFNCDGYDNDYGVRPFCVLNSNIFVSK